jgi:hypothetical protein
VLASVALAGMVAGVAGGARQPLPDKRPPGWIAIEDVSNGCGAGAASIEPGLQNWVGDSATFSDGNPFDPSFTVNFREACNLHDAAYSGAHVWDGINGEFKDFRGMTRRQADDKLQTDMDVLCDEQIPAQWEKTRASCKAGIGHWLAVRIGGAFFGAYKERPDLTGSWVNRAPGWPLCDIGAHPWDVKQTGRTVTAVWRHGADGSQVGRFEGVMTTRDDDNVVKGTFTVTNGQGGAKVSGGDMTFTVKTGETFDFNGRGVGGVMIRNPRSTEGVASAQAPHRCKKVGVATTTRPSAPSSGRTATKLRLTLRGPRGAAWSERDLKTLKATATPTDPVVTAKITDTVSGTATLGGGTLGPGEILFVFATHKTADSAEYVYLCTGKGSCSFTMPANPPGRAALEEAVAEICAGVPPKTNLGQGCVTSFNLRVDVQWTE